MLLSHPPRPAETPIDQRVAVALQEQVARILSDPDYPGDADIIVEGKRYTCHQFLFAVCSKFFLCLFRSGTRGCRDFVLKQVTSSSFDVIMDIMYRGVSRSLTPENFTDVWMTSDMLQLTNVRQVCERYVNRCICHYNAVEILAIANFFKVPVVSTAIAFIAPNFLDIDTQLFNEHVTGENLLEILGHEDLTVAVEDQVVDVVLNWVNPKPAGQRSSDDSNEEFLVDVENLSDDYESSESGSSGGGAMNMPGSSSARVRNANSGGGGTSRLERQITSAVCQQRRRLMERGDLRLLENIPEPGSRESFVPRLIGLTRIFMVEGIMLSRLLSQPYVLAEPNTLSLVTRALIYQNEDAGRKIFWPLEMTCRKRSRFVQVVVFAFPNDLKAYNMKGEMLHNFALYRADNVSNVSLLNYRDHLFLEGTTDSTTSFTILSNEKIWREAFDARNNLHCTANKSLLFARNHVIYRLNAGALHRIGRTPESFWISGFRPELFEGALWTSVIRSDLLENVVDVLTLDDYFIFLVSDNHGLRAYSLQRRADGLVDWGEIPGEGDGVIHFLHDDATFLLRSNGALIEFEQNHFRPVNFRLVAQMWQGEWNPLCAVLYLGTLNVFGNRRECGTSFASGWLGRVAGLFDVKYIEMPIEAFQAVPMTVLRAWLGEGHEMTVV